MKYFILLIVIFSLGCSKNQPDPSNPSQPKAIPYLGDSILLDQGNYCQVENPLIYEDKLIVMITNDDSYDKLL
jgi:hypothetical protein